MDDKALQVLYNGRQLKIFGEVNEWEKLKTFNFLVDLNTNHQELRITGQDANSTSHCIWAGLLLHCQANNVKTGEIVEQSPWHNFKSNTVQWQSEAESSVVCTNMAGMVEEGLRIDNPTVKNLLETGAMKIWGGEHKTSTLIGNPGT